jgi:hypothetical protein
MLLGAALLFAGLELKQILSSDRIPSLQPAPAAPNMIAVPKDQPTLSAAIAASNQGDIIQLAPGAYTETVRIEKSNIAIDGSGAVLLAPKSTEGSDGITVAKAAGVSVRNLRISGDADGDLLTGIHIVDSQVTLQNVSIGGAAGPGIEAAGASTLTVDASSVRDCSGPGIFLRGAAAAKVTYSSILSNGRDAGDHQPGIMIESAQAPVLIGNTIANNGGPAILQQTVPDPEVLSKNLFSLDGRKGRLDDVKVMRKRVSK